MPPPRHGCDPGSRGRGRRRGGPGRSSASPSIAVSISARPTRISDAHAGRCSRRSTAGSRRRPGRAGSTGPRTAPCRRARAPPWCSPCWFSASACCSCCSMSCACDTVTLPDDACPGWRACTKCTTRMHGADGDEQAGPDDPELAPQRHRGALGLGGSEPPTSGDPAGPAWARAPAGGRPRRSVERGQLRLHLGQPRAGPAPPGLHGPRRRGRRPHVHDRRRPASAPGSRARRSGTSARRRVRDRSARRWRDSSMPSRSTSSASAARRTRGSGARRGRPPRPARRRRGRWG